VHIDLLTGSSGDGSVAMQQDVTSKSRRLFWPGINVTLRREWTCVGFSTTYRRAQVSAGDLASKVR